MVHLEKTIHATVEAKHKVVFDLKFQVIEVLSLKFMPVKLRHLNILCEFKEM